MVFGGGLSGVGVGKGRDGGSVKVRTKVVEEGKERAARTRGGAAVLDLAAEPFDGDVRLEVAVGLEADGEGFAGAEDGTVEGADDVDGTTTGRGSSCPLLVNVFGVE